MTDLVAGALIGAGAAVLGAIVTGTLDLIGRRQDRAHDSAERSAEREAAERATREEREAQEHATWRDRAATTLGQALEFATDVHPATATALIQNAEQAAAKFRQLEVKWEALRSPFSVLIVGLPSVTERDLAEDILERFRRIYNGLSWVLADIGRGQWSASTILDLTRDWDEADARLRQLREAIHGVTLRTVSHSADAIIAGPPDQPDEQ